jgi:hypothetical protein
MADYSVDEIDDIKIAVSEVFIALIEHGSGNPIDVHFSVDGDGFHVSGRTAAENFDVANPDLILCRRVLEGVGSEHGVEIDSGSAKIWATVQHAPTG